jgi:hypothetical protein
MRLRVTKGFTLLHTEEELNHPEFFYFETTISNFLYKN